MPETHACFKLVSTTTIQKKQCNMKRGFLC